MMGILPDEQSSPPLMLRSRRRRRLEARTDRPRLLSGPRNDGHASFDTAAPRPAQDEERFSQRVRA